MGAISLQEPIYRHRKLVTDVPGPRSQALHARRAGAVARGVASALPIYVETAKGAILEDVDGNQLIDLGSGIAVTSIGHTVPAVTDAIATQAGRFTHTCFMVTPYEGYVAVCEALAELTPGQHAKRSVLVNSGAEAVENVVKIARYATGRQAVVVLEHAYHGRTNLTMALTAKHAPYKAGFGPFSPEVYRVPTSYPLHDPEGMTGEEAAGRALEQIAVQVGEGAVACVVVEPIQGEGGFIVPAPGFLPALSRWCAESGALFVADEIQTGFARTGDWFACEHEGVVPDLVATAKGIAGGMPLAAVTGKVEVMDAVHAGGLGGTFGGNPVSCAAALAAIQTMRDGDYVGRARHITSIARPLLDALANDCPSVAEVRGRGAMLALEIVKPGSLLPDARLAQAVACACLGEGVVVLTCGTYGNVLRLLPPLSIDDDVLLEGLTVLTSIVGRLGQ